MEKEKYLFIGNIPLLYPESNMAKQLIVEIFFDEDITVGKEKLIFIGTMGKKISKEKLRYVV